MKILILKNLYKNDDVVEYICGAQLQENINLHQEAFLDNQEKEGVIVKLQTNPQRYYFLEFECSPLHDSYDSDRELGALEQQ